MTNKDVVQFPAVIEKIQTMSDHSLQIKMGTEEMKGEAKAKLFEFHQLPIWVLLKETEIKEDDIEIGDERVDKWEKSPSQRLRASLYIVWEQKRPTGSFEEFYRTKMEQFINRVKEKME